MAAISKRYFLTRTVQSIVLLWLVITLLFVMFRSMPGSFADIMMAQGADPEVVEEFEENWGLNDPLYVQYWNYLTNLATGDVGQSIQFRRPVVEYVKFGVFNSFILVAPAITLGYIVGSLYGVLAGMNRGSWFEKYGIIPLFFIGAFPSFFLAIVMILVFAAWLGLFPTSGLVSHETRLRYDSWWRIYFTTDFLHHYILPFLTIFLRYLFSPSLIMRTSVIEVLDQGFIYYNKILGVPHIGRIRQVAKHASLPVITLYPVSMTRAIGGLVLVEIVFNWPGIGNQLVGAVFARDIPVIMFIFTLLAAFIITANVVVDIVYGIIDPRVSVGERN